MANEYTFKYNNNVPFEHNFNEWYFENNEERRSWGEPVLPREQAIELFKNLYADKVDTASS